MNKPLVVITGASSGIGEATAKLFSSHRYPLLLLARRIEKLEALKLPDCLYHQVDVTDSNQVAMAIEQAEAKYGKTDLIINNAGIMLLGEIAKQDPEEWQAMFDVNVMGLLNGIHTVLPSMIQRQHGTIINISSVAGRKTFPNHSAYCGTKFAVHAISENLREEVAKHNVRITTIAPGAVETELLSHTTDNSIKAGYQDWKEKMGGVLNANDVASSILFAYEQPQSVCLREIVLCATHQEP